MKYLISTVITFLLGIIPIQQLNADPISASYLDETLRLQYLTDDQKLLNRFIDLDNYLFSEPLQLTTELLFQPPETESYPEVEWTSHSPLFSNNKLLAGVGLGVSYNLQENWSVYSRYRYLYLRSSQNHGYNGSLQIEAPSDTDSRIHNWSMGTELNLTPKQSLSLIYQGAVQSKEQQYLKEHFVDGSLLVKDFMHTPGLRLSFYIHNIFNQYINTEENLIEVTDQLRSGREYGIRLQYHF